MVDFTFPSAPSLSRSLSKLAKSFQSAFFGIVYTLQTQRNMKIHFLCALSVLIFAMLVPFDFITRIALLFCIAQVFSAEILNTAIEAMIDLFIKEIHPLAKIAKDAAAGAVLICAITSALIFALILYTDINTILAAKKNLLSALWFFIPLVILQVGTLFFHLPKSYNLFRAAGSMLLLFSLLPKSTDLVFFVLAFILISLSEYASL